MSVLLTGGAGYIGSHIAVELIQNNHDVIIVDNLSNSKIEALDNITKITDIRPTFYQIDVTDYEKIKEVFLSHTIDVVIHLAGYKSVGESTKDPLKYYNNNIGGIKAVVTCMNETNVKKIIFSSTAVVYGNPEVLPLKEDSNINILNPYAQSKYTSEIILKDASKESNLSVMILRYFNPVGGHASGLLHENPNGNPNNLFPVIMSVYDGKKEHLEIYGSDYDTEDGTALRDYIHVVDIAKGHLQALKHIQPGFDVFNLATGKAHSVLQVIEKFEKHTNKKLHYVYKDRREGDSTVLYADCTKANKLLEWNALYNLDDMVSSCFHKKFDTEIKSEFVTTFVTGFFYVEGYNIKSVDVQFDHFMQLVYTGIPLSVYISSEYEERLKSIAEKHTNVKLSKVINVKDTWTYSIANIENITMPEVRHPNKDSFEYFVCINNKIDCVYDTIMQNPFETEYFSWIDFGINHVLHNTTLKDNTLIKIAKTPLMEKRIIIPGCWPGNHHNYLHGICWKFCGGFFIGHRDNLIEMWNIYRNFLPQFIKKYNLMTWEVNIWMAMIQECNWNPIWYYALHDDGILQIPEQYFLK